MFNSAYITNVNQVYFAVFINIGKVLSCLNEVVVLAVKTYCFAAQTI